MEKTSASSKGRSAKELESRTKKTYAFVEDIDAFAFAESQKGNSPEQSFHSFLTKVIKFSEASAGAIYLVDGKLLRLVASNSYPARLVQDLNGMRPSASHLGAAIKKKKSLYYAAGKKKKFPARSIDRIPVEKTSLLHIPVVAEKNVIGVVEIVGGSELLHGTHGEFVCSRIARSACMLLRDAERFARKGMSDADYETAIENMMDGVVIVRDLQILYANNALAKLFGYDSPAELKGRGISVFIAPEDRERIIERSRNRMLGKKVPSRYEYKAIRRNGTMFEVEIVVSLIPYRGKQAVLAVHRDITLRHAIEKELQQSEQMFRNVIDGVLTVGDALVVTNLEGKVLQVNSEFERFTGIKKSDALGKEFPYEWLLDEEMARYVLWIKELREKKSLRDFDIHWKHTSGRLISVSMNTTLLYNALNRPVAMMNMARDITERKKLEEENRLQFERLRALYELSRTLTSLLRINEIAEAVYRHLLEVFPFDAFFIDLYDETTNSVRSIICYDLIDNVRTKIPPDAVDSALQEGTGIAKVIEAKRSILENRDANSSEMMEHPFGDKHRRSLSLLYIPMFSKDKTIGVLSIQSYTPNLYDSGHIRTLESFANLSAIALEKAKLYEETVSKSLQLQNRNKELDDFTYVVSHDLKEPLVTVEGYSRVLLKDLGADKNTASVDYVNSIIQACTRMKGLIDDLLVLSRVSRLTEVMENVSLNDILTEVLDDLSFSLQEKHITPFLPENRVTYYCNPTHIKLVFRNLISNAIKFNNSDSPFIKIVLEEGDKRILCSIQDNGIGIEKRFFDKIFVIFQRLHPEYEGSGAGLAIVKKIIELYQGQIWLESDLGKGTTFYFSLPR